MILYFDTFITDKPLNNDFKKLRAIEDKIRLSGGIYKKHSKIDIVKYTLASYSKIKWSNVIIKYEVEDSNSIIDLDLYINKLYPKAVIIHERSSSQKDYKKSIELLEQFDDEWIFYAPNNDHVFIHTDPNVFDDLIEKANEIKESFDSNVSIMYSHYPESLCLTRKGHLINSTYSKPNKIIADYKNCSVVYFSRGNLDSIQIVHVGLMRKWFLSENLNKHKIIRADCLAHFIKPPGQVIIIPKMELCRHYDSYMHTIYKGDLIYISPDLVPPLFIPPGFFEEGIKISYGYNEYRAGWVNINPDKEYIFTNKKSGTDLKINLEDIPVFWRDKIIRIDCQKNLNQIQLYNANLIYKNNLADPWRNLAHWRVRFYVSTNWCRVVLYACVKYFKIVVSILK